MSLRNFWYIACESRALKSRPISVVLFGERLVLWRDAHGQPAVLLDRCAHRNAPLSTGTVLDGCVQCPYHGWRFDATGACSHIPALVKERPIPPAARVPAFRTREQQGYVWVYLGGNEPVADPFTFPHLGEQGWTSFHMKT